MTRLTDQSSWEDGYKNKTTKKERNRVIQNLIDIFKRFKFIKEGLNGYSTIVLDRYVQTLTKDVLPGKVIEIGGAGSDKVMQFKKYYNLEPYILDYSESAVKIAKKKFLEQGIKEENALLYDFFDEEFVTNFKNEFSVVSSFGFIEHFSKPIDVVERHTRVLKKGGLLYVLIPNFNGYEFLIRNIFNRKSIERHNMKMMKTDEYRKCFKLDNLEEIYCGPIGTLRLRLNKLSFLDKATSIILYLFLRGKSVESNLFSPYFIYVGKKKF